MPIKIEKETFSTLLFICRNKCSTFVNKGEHSKLKGCIWQPYRFSSFWERSCSSSFNAKSQMVCYPNLKQWKCCVNAFADRWKDILRAGRELYGHTVRSVAARSILHKFSKRSPAWTKPEKVLMGLFWDLCLALIS